MASARCLGCGGQIEIPAYGVPEGVMARGDRFMHVGCVLDSEALSRTYVSRSPAYFIPRSW